MSVESFKNYPPPPIRKMRNMRVLQLGKFFPLRGGVEKVMYGLLKGLDKSGEECDMLCAAHNRRGRIVSVGRGRRIICCPTLFKVSGTMISPRMILTALRICRGYDVVHVHHPDPMACLALFLSRYKGKVVLHWHSDIVKQKFALRFYQSLQNWLISRADLIIGTSPVYLESSPYLRHVSHKTACLPIGVDALEPERERVEAIRSCYAGKKIIFSLGRMVPYKGFEYLIQAAAYLDDSYVIVIGGEGPLLRQLQNEIRMCGLRGKVELIGYVSERQLPAYFGACTLFCLPSVEKTEAYGIVQIEAMSCGKPVVATRIKGSGVSWVNEHGVTGLNVPPRDSSALANAFADITADETTYNTYSRNARERYLSAFTTEKMISDYKKLLRQCLSR